MTNSRLPTAITRRGLMQGAMGAAAAAALPGGLIGAAGQALAQDRKKTLVIACPATPQGLDMEFDVSLGFLDCLKGMYDTLLAFETIPDPKNPAVMREDTGVHPDKPYGLAMAPRLAEKWEISPDGLKATFKLREGVKSHWGNELTAEDVKWTWDRKFALKVQGAFNTSVLGLETPDQVKVEDKYVVSFNLKKPTPLILKQQRSPANPIYDSTKLKEVGGTDDPWGVKFLKNDCAGFGPYRVRQIVRGQQAVFEARKDYWGPQPYFETVIMKEVPNSSSRLSLLTGGAVDIAEFLQPREYMSLKNSPRAQYYSVDASYMMWCILNAKVKPFDDVRVRQAVNYAIPHDEIIKSVYYGMASPLTAPMPHIYPMADSSFYKYGYDLDKAKALLKEAGLEGGFKTSLSYNAGDPTHEPIALIWQTALRQIGIDVTLDKLPAAVFYDYVAKREKPMIFYLDSPWTPDPGYSLELYFNSRSFIDYSNYENPKVNALIEEALVTLDDEKRLKIFTEVQKTVMDEAPWGFLTYPEWSVAMGKDIKGLTYYTSNMLCFQDLSRA
ncbi:ABC transporter substrate-binding protein [Pseudoxanthobacter sp.]|uniref:ABC transporter substrate-binding protein n=1 Tax=Pseudoxanthobacter sp. TaxID=1925742 RepID=UPI002FE0E822